MSQNQFKSKVTEESFSIIGEILFSKLKPNNNSKLKDTKKIPLQPTLISDGIIPKIFETTKIKDDKAHSIPYYPSFKWHFLIRPELFLLFKSHYLIRFYLNSGKSMDLGIKMQNKLAQIIINNNYDIEMSIIEMISTLNKELKKPSGHINYVLMIDNMMLGHNECKDKASMRGHLSMIKFIVKHKNDNTNKCTLKQEGVAINSLQKLLKCDDKFLEKEMERHSRHIDMINDIISEEKENDQHSVDDINIINNVKSKKKEESQQIENEIESVDNITGSISDSDHEEKTNEEDDGNNDHEINEKDDLKMSFECLNYKKCSNKIIRLEKDNGDYEYYDGIYNIEYCEYYEEDEFCCNECLNDTEICYICKRFIYIPDCKKCKFCDDRIYDDHYECYVQYGCMRDLEFDENMECNKYEAFECMECNKTDICSECIRKWDSCDMYQGKICPNCYDTAYQEKSSDGDNEFHQHCLYDQYKDKYVEHDEYGVYDEDNQYESGDYY